MKRVSAVTGRMVAGSGLLGALLMLASCGVTEPNTEGWQDVSQFSWPTEVGTTMTFRKSVGASGTPVDLHIDIQASDPDPANQTPYGTLDLVLVDTNVAAQNMVHFLSTQTVLVARQEEFGGYQALLLKSPLERGHRWYTSSDSTWEAEVVDLYAWRKIEGELYENVVAVRYRETDPNNPDFRAEQEYIRFYAQGIGEVMTIRNSFGKSSTGAPTTPTLEEKRVLVSTQPAS